MKFKFDSILDAVKYFESKALLERSNVRGVSKRSQHDKLCRERAAVWEAAAVILRCSNLCTNPKEIT
jgi:hypothetical protein